MALLSDLTREQNRTKAMAFIGVSFGITFAIAMVTGPLITQAVGLSGLFWLIALLALAAIAMVIWVVPTPAAHLQNRESAMVRGGFRTVLTNPRLLKLNLGILCVHTLLMSSFVALPPLLEQAGLAREHQWQAYLVTMLIAFVSVVPFIIYAEKHRQMKRVFQACVLVMLVAELVLWQSGQQLWGLLAGLQLFFVGFNVMEALLPSLISKESPPGYKGTAMGVYSTSQFLGVAIGGGNGHRDRHLEQLLREEAADATAADPVGSGDGHVGTVRGVHAGEYGLEGEALVPQLARAGAGFRPAVKHCSGQGSPLLDHRW